MEQTLENKRVTHVLNDNYPKEWLTGGLNNGQELDILEWNNLTDFKYYLKTVQPKNKRQATFDKVTEDITKGKPTVSARDYEIIKQQVKSQLLKKGLITESVYEGYKYSEDPSGELDIAKYLENDPECYLVPNEKYIGHFYTLYINSAYLGGVSSSTVETNIAKVLATVQLLEREHINIQVVLITASSDVVRHKRTLLTLLPLYSYKDVKNIETMSSVIHEAYFRTITFGIREHLYGDELSSGMGVSITLDRCIHLKDVNINLIAEDILERMVT